MCVTYGAILFEGLKLKIFQYSTDMPILMNVFCNKIILFFLKIKDSSRWTSYLSVIRS
jgi:hypothetical protein